MSDGSNDKLAEGIFRACVGAVALGAVFLFGVVAERRNLPPVPQIKTLGTTVGEMFAPGATGRAHHLQPTRGQGSGVVTNAVADDGALILLKGFFDEENQARLVRRDGSVVRKWSLDYFKHFPDAEARACAVRTSLFVDTHGVHLSPEGDLAFNYEYCGTVKLDQCGGVQWTLNDDTHHSLTLSERGHYWIIGRWSWTAESEPERFKPFSTAANEQTILEDTLMRVSADGEILEEVSIPGLMRDSGLEAVLTATGKNFTGGSTQRSELVHANKVAELPSDIADAFPMFEPGDLAISMRQLNLIIVVDPDTKEVKWHQTGPWLRQHDPEWRPDGRISIFNNNVYRTAYRGEQTDLSADFATNIILVDPASGDTEVTFGQEIGQEMLSVIRGQHELLPDDGILITEFDAGRVLEVNAAREIVWEFVNEYSDTHVGEITNAQWFAPDYFTTDWAACPS